MSLNDLRDSLHEQGYDKEEAYFQKQQRELLERMRQKKAAEEAASGTTATPE